MMPQLRLERTHTAVAPEHQRGDLLCKAVSLDPSLLERLVFPT
jgi:hypothetical protein